MRTRAKLLTVAMELFASQGYDATTTRQIAEQSGVSQMTFFRHFPTKESVLISDPYDPLIAELVAAQSCEHPLIIQIRDGLLQALGEINEIESQSARSRIAIANQLPSLRAAMVAASYETETAIVDALVAKGSNRLQSRVAASATLAALNTALMAWGSSESEVSLIEMVSDALAVLVGEESSSKASGLSGADYHP